VVESQFERYLSYGAMPSGGSQVMLVVVLLLVFVLLEETRLTCGIGANMHG
jgi:hypothetical protein